MIMENFNIIIIGTVPTVTMAQSDAHWRNMRTDEAYSNSMNWRDWQTVA